MLRIEEMSSRATILYSHFRGLREMSAEISASFSQKVADKLIIIIGNHLVAYQKSSSGVPSNLCFFDCNESRLTELALIDQKRLSYILE